MGLRLRLIIIPLNATVPHSLIDLIGEWIRSALLYHRCSEMLDGIAAKGEICVLGRTSEVGLLSTVKVFDSRYMPHINRSDLNVSICSVIARSVGKRSALDAP